MNQNTGLQDWKKHEVIVEIKDSTISQNIKATIRIIKRSNQESKTSNTTTITSKNSQFISTKTLGP